MADRNQQSFRLVELGDRLGCIPPQCECLPRELDLRGLRKLHGAPCGDRLQHARGIFRHGLCRFGEGIGGDVHVPDGDMGEPRISDGEAVAADQSVKSGVDPVGAAAVMRVLQDHFRPGVADVEDAGIDVAPSGETKLVHLETDTVLQAHALFGGFDGKPTLRPKQGNDLRGRGESVAGGNTGAGMLGEYRGSGAAEIVGRKRFEGAGGGNDSGRIHDFGGTDAPQRGRGSSGPRYAGPTGAEPKIGHSGGTPT